MFKIVSVFIITAVLFSADNQTARADTRLLGNEIKQLITGNTAVGERQKKWWLETI